MRVMTICSRRILLGVFTVALFIFSFQVSDAATLRLSPETGVYTSGGTFSVRVLVNTAGQSINAAEGRISYSPNELSVVNVSRNSSIFNLWTEEPTFSNSSGVVSFGGGSPNGYSGSAGTVISITFRALGSGPTPVTFAAGSVLAADGQGTNVLTNMQGGSYTIGASSKSPEPEYIAPPNTPAAPQIESDTHPDPNGWYATTTANVSWQLSGDITSVRTLLDSNPGTIPTKVYADPIRTLTVSNLDEGVSYLHVQFRNAEGWGRVAHYRIAVDTEKPDALTISQTKDNDPSRPEQRFHFDVTDATSPVRRYQISIDGESPIEFNDTEGTGIYTTPTLEPGNHNIVVEAFDAAGNSIVATHAFTIQSFDRPVFTEYPTRINNEVIPVIRGETRPNANVTITVAENNGEIETKEVTSDGDGVFTFIPDEPLSVGVYDITAVARDEKGAKSEVSEAIRIVVEVPGYIQIGSYVVSVLSVLIPIGALLALLIFGVWYLLHRLRVWRRSVRKETSEAEQALAHEFDVVVNNLEKNIEKLKKSRKGKLTKAETTLIDEISRDIQDARKQVRKEIQDIEDVVE